MGNRLDRNEVKEILVSTNFTQKEIHEQYDHFLKRHPTGHIQLADFVDKFSVMFPAGRARDYAVYVFKAYDRDDDGTVDFKEFLTTLSVAARGDIDEKLRWVFEMYDINKDGRVSRDEARQIIYVSCI